MIGKDQAEKTAYLAVFLYRAKLAAEKARDRDSEDGGTCNLDCAFALVGRDAAIWESACLAAGVGYSISVRRTKKAIWFNISEGQGNLRTRMQKAFQEKMVWFGYDVMIHYAMD